MSQYTVSVDDALLYAEIGKAAIEQLRDSRKSTILEAYNKVKKYWLFGPLVDRQNKITEDDLPFAQAVNCDLAEHLHQNEYVMFDTIDRMARWHKEQGRETMVLSEHYFIVFVQGWHIYKIGKEQMEG